MKNQFSKKGFTLVEIMIVVVIIGLLAALAIPAFKKVRNNAIEKSLINDARQISSAAQQYCSENATSDAPASEIRKFISGNKLSSGVMITNDIASTVPTTDIASLGSAYFSIGTGVGAYFTLGHNNYDRTLSSKAALVTQASGGTSVIIFNTDDGQPR